MYSYCTGGTLHICVRHQNKKHKVTQLNAKSFAKILVTTKHFCSLRIIPAIQVAAYRAVKNILLKYIFEFDVLQRLQILNHQNKQ
jgi:hypothetical protein